MTYRAIQQLDLDDLSKQLILQFLKPTEAELARERINIELLRHFSNYQIVHIVPLYRAMYRRWGVRMAFPTVVNPTELEIFAGWRA